MILNQLSRQPIATHQLLLLLLAHLGPMLALCCALSGAMLTYLGPILGAFVGSSWGTFCTICVDTGP